MRDSVLWSILIFIYVFKKIRIKTTGSFEVANKLFFWLYENVKLSKRAKAIMNNKKKPIRLILSDFQNIYKVSVTMWSIVLQKQINELIKQIKMIQNRPTYIVVWFSTQLPCWLNGGRESIHTRKSKLILNSCNVWIKVWIKILNLHFFCHKH